MKSVTILGRRFKIILAQNIKHEDRDAGGLVDFDEMTISLDSDMGSTQREKALLHEIAHIGCDVSGIDQRITPEMVEVICQTMSNTFYDFIKQLK